MQTYVIHEDHAKALQEIAEKIARLAELMSTPENELTAAKKDEAAAITDFMLTNGRLGYFGQLVQGIKETLNPVTIDELYAKSKAANPPSYIEKPRYIPPTYEEICERGYLGRSESGSR